MRRTSGTALVRAAKGGRPLCALGVGAAEGSVRYRVQWSSLDNLKNEDHVVGEELVLRESRVSVPDRAWGPPDDVGYRYAVADIASLLPEFPRWEAPVRVTLRDRAGRVDIVGIERPR